MSVETMHVPMSLMGISIILCGKGSSVEGDALIIFYLPGNHKLISIIIPDELNPVLDL